MPRIVKARSRGVAIRPKGSMQLHELLIKRPSPELDERARKRWREELMQFGLANFAKARKAGWNRQSYHQIERSALYTGEKGISDLVKEARSISSAKKRLKLLNIVETCLERSAPSTGKKGYEVLVRYLSDTPSVREREQVLDILETIRNPASKMQVFARFEHLWPDGSAAVSVHHERIGWLEFDLSAQVLPDGIRPRDQIEVRLYLDRKGNVVRHQVPPGAKVVRPTEPSVGDQLEARLPRPPGNWDDEADVARYQRELEAWDKNSGLGRR